MIITFVTNTFLAKNNIEIYKLIDSLFIVVLIKPGNNTVINTTAALILFHKR